MAKEGLILRTILSSASLRLAAASSLILFGFTSSAMANPIIDPHALFATGGDADPIDSGHQIILSAPGGGNTGGGIFVFNNNTGNPLSAVEVDITLPDSFGPFTFTGTIFTPGPGATSITETILFNACGNTSDTNSFCVEMTFASSPGPLVPLGGNFVLDFDKPVAQGPPPVYGGVDALVATGNYTCETCGTDTSNARVGEWSQGAVGFVTPFTAVPEPLHYAGLLAGMLALAVYSKSRRS